MRTRLISPAPQAAARARSVDRLEAALLRGGYDALAEPAVNSFDPHQPRDADGQWVAGGGRMSPPAHIQEAVDRFNSVTKSALGKDPLGMGTRVETGGGRFVDAQLKPLYEIKDGAVTQRFAVRIDFGVHGRENTSVSEHMEKESLALLRKVKEVTKAYHDSGFEIEADHADKRREEVYSRVLSKMGMRNVPAMGAPNVWNEGVLNLAGPHTFACVHVPVTDPDTLARVRAVADKLDPADVLDREDDAHVTVRYGLHDNGDVTLAAVRGVLAGYGPAAYAVGRLSVFADPEHDVLKFDVSSPDLHALNARLRAVAHTQKWPEYKPHVTVAYLRPGTGPKYVGLDPAGGMGPVLTASAVTYSPAAGDDKAEIRLTTDPTPAAVTNDTGRDDVGRFAPGGGFGGQQAADAPGAEPPPTAGGGVSDKDRAKGVTPGQVGDAKKAGSADAAAATRQARDQYKPPPGPTANYDPPRASDGRFGTVAGHHGGPSGGGGSHGPAAATAAGPRTGAAAGHGEGRDITGAKTAGPRNRIVGKDTTHEGVKHSHAKDMTPAEADHVIAWHDNMTQVGKNAPNGRLPKETHSAPYSAEERGALQKYSYKNDGPLNSKLRGRGDWDHIKDANGAPTGERVPYPAHFYDRMEHHLDAAFAKTPVMSKPVTVVRGMFQDGRHDPAALKGFTDAVEAALKTGKPLTMPGYTSTAAAGGLAYRMGLADAASSIPPAFKGRVALTIKATHGIDMGPHSQLPGEAELLLPKNSQFKVSKVHRAKDGTLHVEMEQVPHAAPTKNSLTPPLDTDWGTA